VLAIAANQRVSSSVEMWQVRGQLLVRRRAALLVFELGDRLLDAARPAANRPRHPVELAQAVVHRPTDPWHRERLELDTSFRIEPFDRVDQAEDAGADQVTGVDARREARADTTGDELDQRRVVDDQVVSGGRVPAVQPPGPLHLEVGVFGNDAHALGWASR
jgi:hypothetical protein